MLGVVVGEDSLLWQVVSHGVSVIARYLQGES